MSPEYQETTSESQKTSGCWEKIGAPRNTLEGLRNFSVYMYSETEA